MVVHDATAHYWVLAFCSSGFEACDILRGEVVSHSPNPQPGGTGLCMYVSAQKIGWPRYTPRFWVNNDSFIL